MKILFKRQIEQSSLPVVLKAIKNVVEVLHRRYADMLNAKAAKMKRNTLFRCFWIFCLTFSMLNVYCLIHSVNKTSSFLTDKISVPSHVLSNDTIPQMPLVDDKEFVSILSFQLFLDSLKHSPSGAKIYDSLVSHRYGLLDSLSVIENMFKDQFKKQYYGKASIKH